MGDFATGGTMKFRLNVPATEEDCPKRTQFLAELALKKGRQPSDWRTVLGYKERPDSGQGHGEK